MKKIALIIIICFNSVLIFSQQLKEPTKVFNTIFLDKNEVNSFYIGGNPAYLKFDNSDELLSIQSTYTNETGDYKKYIDPETTRLYQLSFTGKKTLDSQQVFKGSFGIQKLERKKWDWFFTKYYDNWNPFLFGDSTSGNSHYNGIVMNAGYSAVLGGKYLIGANINYSVDEGLKEVTPHPTSKNRDIDFSFGGGYLLNDKISFGAYANIYDYQEIIDYEQDDFALYQETILLKYTSYNRPYVLPVKTGTRYSYQNGYSGYANMTAKPNEWISTAVYVGGGFEHSTLQDGSTVVYPAGYYENTFYKGGVNALFNITDKLNAGLYYDFKIDDMWARHPSFDVVIMQNNFPEHIIKAGVDYQFCKNIKAGVEAGIDIAKYDYKDYFSQITWSAKPKKTMLGVGSQVKYNDNFSFFISFNYSHQSSDDNSFLFSPENGGSAANIIRKNDILFYQTNYNQYAVSFTPAYQLKSLGLVKLNLNYSYIKPEKEFWANSAKRETFEANLEFRLNVY